MAYTTIDDPSAYFQTTLYTGNGSTNAITGVGFQPDWTWIKYRDSGTFGHDLYDSVRGATKVLNTNNTNAEYTEVNRLTSFDSDGFSLGSEAPVNNSGGTFVSWNWKAGGSASSNSNGSITSSVSASTDSGFSIVTYTGTGSNATVGHGLGVAPSVVICKDRTNANNWRSYFSQLGNANALNLNTTDGSFSTTNSWNSTSPTSNVFSIGTNSNVNASSANHIAYCFAEKKGFSKFGSYTGAGSNFPFIYTGFKPAVVIRKGTSTTKDWLIFDNKRPVFNATDKKLEPNTSESEASANANAIDLLSNGFKCRGTGTAGNTNGDPVIYMAFAESPFVTSTGIPTTAR